MATRETNAANTKATTFTCPECGRVFTRAQALGAHRRHVHGVAGTSKTAKANATRASANGRRAARAAGATRPRTATASRAVASRKDGDGRAKSVDRDALLRTLFPAGIPPRHELMVAVNAWLEEGERLARRSETHAAPV